MRCDEQLSLGSSTQSCIMIVRLSVVKESQQLLSHTENFERFLTCDKVSETYKSPNSSNPYAMKV